MANHCWHHFCLYTVKTKRLLQCRGPLTLGQTMIRMFKTLVCFLGFWWILWRVYSRLANSKTLQSMVSVFSDFVLGLRMFRSGRVLRNPARR